MKKNLFTLIIPVKKINKYVDETFQNIKKQDYKNWELIIVENSPSIVPKKYKSKKIKIICSGKVGPGKKRDIACKIAKGNIIAFLDDDSYPKKNYLSLANKIFKLNKDICGIGGPGVTPRNSTIFQKISGSVFLSRFSGGFPERYMSIGKIKMIYDWPSVNLMIKKNYFLRAGGFNSRYWPGEDTELCLKLTKKMNLNLLYVPNLIVYHHRRKNIFSHIKQVSAYGLHRGYFFKSKPETSRKVIYILPSLLFLFSIQNIFFILNFYNSFSILNSLNVILWLLYFVSLLLSFVDMIKQKNEIIISLLSIPLIYITHFFYGFYFLIGLFKKEIKSKFR
jgi:cellulose synthase/poly-beta-1,6-N-acetylglucosamine synthase-like glycosyltransferase